MYCLQRNARKSSSLPSHCAVKSVHLDAAGVWVSATELYVGHLQTLPWTDMFTVFNCINISEGRTKSLASQELCPVPRFRNIQQWAALCIALEGAWMSLYRCASGITKGTRLSNLNCSFLSIFMYLLRYAYKYTATCACVLDDCFIPNNCTVVNLQIFGSRELHQQLYPVVYPLLYSLFFS